MCTPNLYAMLDKPFYYERRFVVNASDPVEHKDEQYLELPFDSRDFQFLNSIPVLGRYLETGNSLFEELLADDPVMSSCKVPTLLLLHGNVILHFIDLPYRGDTVQTVSYGLMGCSNAVD